MIDIFVNKTVFYKQVAGLLEEVFNNIEWTNWRSDNILETQWVDPSIKKKISSIKYDNEKAIEGLRKIYAILEEGNKSKVRTKINPEFKQLERLSVIKGGLYVSPAEKAHEALSDTFREFVEKERRDTQ
jgi:hypothetical protein